MADPSLFVPVKKTDVFLIATDKLRKIKEKTA